MKLRRLLLLSCIGFIGAIGVSQAIDINIPGARPDISKEAYQEYRAPRDVAKRSDDYQEMQVKKFVQRQPNYNSEKFFNVRNPWVLTAHYVKILTINTLRISSLSLILKMQYKHFRKYNQMEGS